MFQIYFHGKNYESLLHHIDAKYLTKRYGGTMDLPHLNRMDIYQLLCKYQDNFEGEPYEVLAQRVAVLTWAYCRDEILNAPHRLMFNIG
jgi:hypothetical protein